MNNPFMPGPISCQIGRDVPVRGEWWPWGPAERVLG